MNTTTIIEILKFIKICLLILFRMFNVFTIMPSFSCIYNKDVPVVRNYMSVFLKDLPGLPPDRKIVFSIELMLRTASIS